MEKLPEKANKTALATWQSGGKAIELRRQLSERVANHPALLPVEKSIFAASVKSPISEIPDAELVQKCGNLFRYIAIDVGYTIPAATNEWAYTCTRLVDILKKYYSQLTLADVKLAFELAVTGMLDDHLPRDGRGNPDKSHYQNFNADYLAKILNAYKRKQCTIFYKVNELQLDSVSQPAIRSDVRKWEWDMCRCVYLRYKYSGKLVLSAPPVIIHNWLSRIGWADSVEITGEDKRKAYTEYFKRVSQGLINRYEANNIRRKGWEAAELNFTAYEIARKKEIKRAFDRMIYNEIQIDKYLITEI